MGPALVKGDINNDGLEDIFVGGEIGQSSQLFVQVTEGKFILAKSQPWIADSSCEDVNAIFFDANNDGFADLYVVSGGNEYADGSPEYGDRLYINDKKGNFIKRPCQLMNSSKHAIAIADIDNDGDQDIFIGGSCVPGSFPLHLEAMCFETIHRKILFNLLDITSSLAESIMHLRWLPLQYGQDLE